LLLSLFIWKDHIELEKAAFKRKEAEQNLFHDPREEDKEAPPFP
jgi:hypothetical protein